MRAEPRVVVVGAGPTGLTLAAQLYRHGVPCRIIDAGQARSDRSRAIGMSSRSLEVLDELGAARDAVERGVPCHGATFYSRGRPIGRLDLSTAHTRFPFMLVLPQSDTELVLERQLERLGGTVERRTRLAGLIQDGSGVTLTLEGPTGAETTTADWVVGADGAHSTVRELSGIEFAGSATGDVFVSVDAFVRDGPSHGEGHYYFFSGGLAVIIGLPDGSHRLTALLRSARRDPDTAAELDRGDIEALVARGTGLDLGVRELRNAGWGIAKVRIQSRIASTFLAGRCLLAGDAAHTFGPVGGQGMNGGIQDAHNLAWKLALVARGAVGPALLASYVEERRPAARGARHHAAQQAALATVRSGPLVAARDVAFAGLSRAGLLDRKIGPSVTQLALDYGGAWFGPVGRRLPDTPLHPSGTLFDLVRDAMFTVLVLGADGDHPVRMAAFTEALTRRFGDLVAVRQVRRDADPGGVLHGRIGVRGPTAVLVRPDAHIVHRCPLDRATVAVSSALRQFVPSPSTEEVPRP